MDTGHTPLTYVHDSMRVLVPSVCIAAPVEPVITAPWYRCTCKVLPCDSESKTTSEPDCRRVQECTYCDVYGLGACSPRAPRVQARQQEKGRKVIVFCRTCTWEEGNFFDIRRPKLSREQMAGDGSVRATLPTYLLPPPPPPPPSLPSPQQARGQGLQENASNRSEG